MSKDIDELVNKIMPELESTANEFGGWDADAVANLDRYIDKRMDENPSESYKQAMVMHSGFYLGECIRRAVPGAKWVLEEDGLYIVLPNGFRVIPHRRVAKRMTDPSDACEALFHAALNSDAINQLKPQVEGNIMQIWIDHDGAIGKVTEKSSPQKGLF
jgi:hypothetical protein